MHSFLQTRHSGWNTLFILIVTPMTINKLPEDVSHNLPRPVSFRFESKKGAVEVMISHLKRTREGAGEGAGESAMEDTEPLVVDSLERVNAGGISACPPGVAGSASFGRCGMAAAIAMGLTSSLSSASSLCQQLCQQPSSLSVSHSLISWPIRAGDPNIASRKAQER